MTTWTRTTALLQNRTELNLEGFAVPRLPIDYPRPRCTRLRGNLRGCAVSLVRRHRQPSEDSQVNAPLDLVHPTHPQPASSEAAEVDGRDIHDRLEIVAVHARGHAGIDVAHRVRNLLHRGTS